MAQAMQLFKAGAYPQAINLLQQVVAATPSELVPRLQLVKACLDWIQIRSGQPLVDIEPATLSAEGAHFLQLASSHLAILQQRHAASPHVQNLLAALHLFYGQHEKASQCLKRVLKKDPANSEAQYNLGCALLELGRFDEACKQFARLTAHHPKNGMGWQMLGQSHMLCGRPQDAVSAYERAIDLLPDWFQPYGGLASALRDLKRYQEAKDVLRRGLQRHPDNRDLNFTLATIALSTADWETGWRHYPCRKTLSRCVPFAAGYEIPMKHPGQAVILYDQGIGDEVFFLRFTPLLAAAGVDVHYTTNPKLFPLLRGCLSIAQLKAAEPEEGGDRDCLVGDLPYFIGTRLGFAVPPPLPLRVDAERVAVLAEKLARFGPPPYLGVTWRAGTQKQAGAKGVWRVLAKDISPELLARTVRDWPGTVVVLQRLPGAEEMAAFHRGMGRPILDWSIINEDLREALAGLSLLDEYVGVSNTNMHLLAGVGMLGRVLVPYPPEWRWMAEGDESPWFPGFKIYRQALSGSWDETLAKLKQDLSNKYRKQSPQ